MVEYINLGIANFCEVWYDGKEVLELCDNVVDIDLIFMDLNMPVMDGYEATRYSKRNQEKELI